MTSKLASVVADRGTLKRNAVRGCLIHTTGSGIVEQAKKVGADPEAFAVDYYLRAPGKYPHALIAHDGSVYSFCDELKYAAHCAWAEAERRSYAERGGTWMLKWIDTLGDGKFKDAPFGFYADWHKRWGGGDLARGLAYNSPIDMLAQLDAANRGPNSVYYGIELLDAKPFTRAQHEALAALIAGVFDRHEILDVRAIEPGTLPQAWLCTHSDISPLRRYQRRKDGAGFPWDPRVGQLDWALLERLLRA